MLSASFSVPNTALPPCMPISRAGAEYTSLPSRRTRTRVARSTSRSSLRPFSTAQRNSSELPCLNCRSAAAMPGRPDLSGGCSPSRSTTLVKANPPFFKSGIWRNCVAEPIWAVAWSRTATRIWYAPCCGTGTSSVYKAPSRSAPRMCPGATRRSKLRLTNAQLNRNDTLPGLLSPGQVVIPGLSALTRAEDYAGRLDLFRGEFSEHGGGMSVKAYVQPDTDALVVDVTGANPIQPQTAMIKLWPPRSPHAVAAGPIAFLAESWIDNTNPGASGRAFGSLSAIIAQGRNVSAVVTDPLTVTVSFRPFADGHFRIVVAAPHYNGIGNALDLARRTLTPVPDTAHVSWWHDFWTRAATIRITSKDGVGEYMENLRNLYLYVAAIEKGVEYPGSQAGIADMISAAQDEHRWDPSAFWHWNLRMQVAANIGAGLYELNEPYFNLYRENLARS